MKRDDIILQIAKKEFRIETLTPAHRDCFDFHDVHVLSIKKALEEAFEAGRAKGQAEILLKVRSEYNH